VKNQQNNTDLFLCEEKYNTFRADTHNTYIYDIAHKINKRIDESHTLDQTDGDER